MQPDKTLLKTQLASNPYETTQPANPYETYPYIPDVPPPPPKQKHTLYKLSLIVLISLCLVLGTMVMLLLLQQRQPTTNPIKSGTAVTHEATLTVKSGEISASPIITLNSSGVYSCYVISKDDNSILAILTNPNQAVLYEDCATLIGQQSGFYFSSSSKDIPRGDKLQCEGWSMKDQTSWEVESQYESLASLTMCGDISNTIPK